MTMMPPSTVTKMMSTVWSLAGPYVGNAVGPSALVGAGAGAGAGPVGAAFGNDVGSSSCCACTLTVDSRNTAAAAADWR